MTIAEPAESSDRDATRAKRSFRVVGLGASAGGLESLEQFFAHLPPDPGMAFVVVQHLSPDFRSMMSELLARHCRMPIEVAEDGVEVKANRVYLLPPKKEITIDGGRLALTDKEPATALTLPIDRFFRSLAADVGADAVGIVLSGSGSDGSRGVADIKRAGGLVLVESPDTAKFDGMPRSTLATGHVDYSGPAPDLARFLAHGGRPPPREGAEEELAEDEPPLDTILRLLRNQYGLDFSNYKRSTVDRRIVRRMALVESPGLEEYAERIAGDPDELVHLYHDLLIGVTRFFRDPEAFAVLETRAIPEILERVGEKEEVRVWVAGCATGEEPYSIAMLLYEQMAERGRAVNFKVLATDVHRASLEAGSAGVYAEEQLEHVSQRRRDRFFTRIPRGFQVSQDLRQRIVFAPHNVTQDAPFTKMHLVTCRNLLIYLEPEAQKTVLSLFHFGLAPGGVLFLGSSEATGAFAEEFDAIDEHWKIYRKRRDVRLIDPLRLPMARKTATASARLLAPVRASGTDPQLLSLYDRLLDRYMPPGILVDEERTLVDSFGGAEQYLRFARRRPSMNVLDLLDGDLRTVVAGAVQRVLSGEPSIRFSGVPLPVAGGERRASVAAEVLTTPRSGGKHVLITFHDEAERAPAAPPGETVAEFEGDAAAAERLNALESELAYARETLQAAYEEQQTSNEELQATNEELVASNEELQSTNEELHSVNEELYTVNGEYQKKILELRELYDDMQHLLDGSDIGTLFLDRELRIRRFTPRVASVFHLRPEDVGRDFRDFSNDLEREDFLEEVERALDAGVATEDEVEDRHGTTWFLRILPYRPSADDGAAASAEPAAVPGGGERPEGVMVSLTDISVLDDARAQVNQLSAIVASSEDAILGNDLEGVITSWNRGAERLYGYSAKEAVGRSIRSLAAPGHERTIDECLEAVRRGERVERVETVRARKDGTRLEVSVTISPIRDRNGELVGTSSIERDITELKGAQRDLMAREARIRLLLDSTAEAIYGLDAEGVCTFCNPACVRMLGYDSADELIGRRMHSLVHHTDPDGAPIPEAECPIYSALRTGEGAHSDRELLFRADGSSFPVEVWSHPIGRDGEVEGAVVTFLDITERRRADEELRLAARRREHFLAMLSHELRNPLSAVLNAAKVMQTRAEDGQALERARAVIERQSGHMARLLDDLLDVSRITRGGITLRKTDLDLAAPIRHAAEASAPHLESTETRLELDLPEDPVPVRGDPARLQQIVVNLLTNAAKYSPPGTTVRIVLRNEDGEARLSVRDQGYGIPEEILPQVFELFVQSEQGLARTDGGLGLGLALVHELVRLHGGRIEARSDGRDRGSEFVVALPVVESSRVAGDGRERKGGGGRRIVLVEDQDDAREMLAALLEANGFDVTGARDGREAIERIAEVHPDAAIIDIGLPVLDGYEVARRLRRDPALEDVLLVALTGYGTDEDVAAAYDAGFDEHLTKPAEPREIREILRRRG